MESTLLHSYLSGAKLRRWLSTSDSHPIFREVKELFDKIYSPRKVDVDQSSIYAAHDGWPSPPRSTPTHLKTLVRGGNVWLRARLSYRRIMYASSQTHLGNSLVHYYPGGNREVSMVPGCIKYIYSSDGQQYSFAVARQIPIHSVGVDPFSQYPHFSAKTYSTQLSGTLEQVEPEWVFSHYARWNINSEEAVILSLSKVSPMQYLTFAILAYSALPGIIYSELVLRLSIYPVVFIVACNDE